MDSQTPKSRLEHKQQSTEQQRTEQQQGRMFESAEELIRHDAAQTTPPPAIAERLKDSIANEPQPQRSWWRRLFSR